MLTKLTKTVEEIGQYRDVLTSLISQHLKIKYKRTVFGYLWSLLNPLLQLLVLGVVFSHVVRLGMKDYTLYLFSGLIAWNFFSGTLVQSAVSLVEAETYLKKVYLPKIIFPLSRLILMLIDFLFALAALSILGLFLGFHISWTVALVPIAMLSLAIFALGVGIILSVGAVYFRDVNYLLSVGLNLLYFATPILYPITSLPEKFQKYLVFNPLVVQVSLFQKLIYAGQVPEPVEWATAFGMSLFTLLLGWLTLEQFDDDLVFQM